MRIAVLVETVTNRMFVMTTGTLVMLAVADAELRAQAHSSLGVTVGAAQTAQRNPGASPYAYSGAGMSGELRYARESGRAGLDVRFGASFATLRSAITSGSKPVEELTSATISAGYVRPLGDTTARLRWQIGGRLSARFTETQHIYATPFAYSDDFGFYVVTLGPELRASRPKPRLFCRGLASKLHRPIAPGGCGD